ncbi:MAG: hypothetical protein Q8K60_05475, partial [Parachlamydiaceae bacterium]|nr:hypothetical protein [Parachlamydiaceae bacterium]
MNVNNYNNNNNNSYYVNSINSSPTEFEEFEILTIDESKPVEDLLDNFKMKFIADDFVKSNINDKLEFNNEQKDLINEIVSKLSDKYEHEKLNLLRQAKSHPMQFALIAYGIAQTEQCYISYTSTLLENCSWPSQELKEQFLPELLCKIIMRKGINIEYEFKNIVYHQEEINKKNQIKPKLNYHCISLILKQIFGIGDFRLNSKPLSVYLAKSIGLAIKRTVENYLNDSNIKQKYINTLGFGIDFRHSIDTQISPSMAASIMPYLKDIPGIVYVNLNDIGMPGYDLIQKNKYFKNDFFGFLDEHFEILLEMIKSLPHLLKLNINLIGMSPANIANISDELKKIVSTSS